MRWVIEGLVVSPEVMRSNLDASGGLVFSQSVLLALIAAGIQREEAYAVVQENAATAHDQGRPLGELLKSDPAVTERLDPGEIEACLDPARYLAGVGVIFERLEAL
jgi:adenylosuccinate lyase